MILEHAEIIAKPGNAAAMADALNGTGVAILTADPGCQWVKVGRSLENSDKFLLLVAWESVEAHKAFKGPSGQSAFGALIYPLAAGGSMEYFDLGSTQSGSRVG